MTQSAARHPLTGKPSVYASNDPKDVAWRVEQGWVDAAIEGVQPDPRLAAFVEKMKADGVPVLERIERLKAFVTAPISDAAE